MALSVSQRKLSSFAESFTDVFWGVSKVSFRPSKPDTQLWKHAAAASTSFRYVLAFPDIQLTLVRTSIHPLS